MWYEPPKYKKAVRDANIDLINLVGELDDKAAKYTLAQYLRRNIGCTIDLLAGVKLAPYQIITIKGMLNRNYTLCVFGRGCGKTFSAAIYCILQCLFEPGTNILIAGPTFRTSRFIFNHIEKITEKPQAKLLMDCFGAKARRNDEWKWKINGGEIVAIPLNGEKIRGFRANVLVIDEFLLMSEEMVEKVLIPYLVAPQDIGWRQKIREKEDRLIRQGRMTENDRMEFKNNSKMVALSSASYTCEYLYRKYNEYVDNIYSDKLYTQIEGEEDGKLIGGTYFISQLAWNAIPEHMIDKGIIKLAKSNQANSANFAREYGAQFTDGSDSYFSMKKMLECTIPDGEEPTLLLKGKHGKKYILAIDPNFSNSATADHFAMCVLELDEENPEKMSGTVVHSYAKAGKDLKDHIKYFYYLMTNFDIHMTIIDHAGYQFIEAANENELFRNARMEFKLMDFDTNKEGEEYNEELKKARRSYNREIHRNVFYQVFTSDFIRRANEWLQGCMDYKKIWFASGIRGSESSFDSAIGTKIDLDLIGEVNEDKNAEGDSRMIQFIDSQDVLIRQTRYQCASIEVKSTVKGTQTFDLPQMMRRDTGEKRARRDSYTALMLAAWAMKCYYDMKSLPVENVTETFTPFFGTPLN